MSGICGLRMRGLEGGLTGPIASMTLALQSGGGSEDKDRFESRVFSSSVGLGVHRLAGVQGGLLERPLADRVLAVAFPGTLDEDGPPAGAEVPDLRLDRDL